MSECLTKAPEFDDGVWWGEFQKEANAKGNYLRTGPLVTLSLSGVSVSFFLRLIIIPRNLLFLRIFLIIHKLTPPSIFFPLLLLILVISLYLLHPPPHSSGVRSVPPHGVHGIQPYVHCIYIYTGANNSIMGCPAR